MEPPGFENMNLTVKPTAAEYPFCEEWRDTSEGSVFHLANIFLFFGFMGGSGFYGLLYLFTFLTVGFFCSTLWSWSDYCITDSFLWSFALFGVCLGQVLHIAYRLRSVSFDKEFEELHNCMFQKLGVSLTHFGEIVACCDGQVHTIERDHCFAIEGKTSIDKLSVLLSGRIRVTVNGEFLHYIYPFQFLDSPEWDSLRPSEEGVFQEPMGLKLRAKDSIGKNESINDLLGFHTGFNDNKKIKAVSSNVRSSFLLAPRVTLCADNPCRYVGWRRKKLYLLFAKHRYIAKIFALIVRNDIAEKLYSLNDKAYDRLGHRYDLRLPSYCHMSEPELEKAEVFLQVPVQGARTA